MNSFTFIPRFSFVLLLALLACRGLGGDQVAAATTALEEVGWPDKQYCASDGPNGTRFKVGLNCRYIYIEGYPRTYLVYIPPSAGTDAPVVFIFHGSNGDGDGFLQNSGWLAKARAEGFVLVSASGLRYCPMNITCLDTDPAGWETKWHHYHLHVDYDLGRPMPGFPATAQWPPDDVHFTSLVMDDIEAGLAVNSEHFYASGFSSGAAFSARLAVEIPDRLAAVAYSSSGIVDDSLDLGSPAIDIPVFAVIGTRFCRQPTTPKVTIEDEVNFNFVRFLDELQSTPADQAPFLPGFHRPQTISIFMPVLGHLLNHPVHLG